MLFCTGKGEYFVRSVCAYDISARMQYGGASLKQAAHDCIHDGMRKTVVPPGEYMSVCFVLPCAVRRLEVVGVCRVCVKRVLRSHRSRFGLLFGCCCILCTIALPA
jgi:hypothetical protein